MRTSTCTGRSNPARPFDNQVPIGRQINVYILAIVLRRSMDPHTGVCSYYVEVQIRLGEDEAVEAAAEKFRVRASERHKIQDYGEQGRDEARIKSPAPLSGRGQVSRWEVNAPLCPDSRPASNVI